MTAQPPSLKAKAMRGTVWTLIGYGTAQVLRLANNLIMTRLLVPEMFGLMATVSVVMIGLELCTDAGLFGCVVRNKMGNQPYFLNTAWTVKVIRGGLLWLVACAVALGIWFARTGELMAVDSVYSQPELPLLIAVVGFSTVLTGLASTNLFLANRQMAFGRMTLIEISSQAFSIAVMIIWALLDVSVWALASGYLARAFLKLVLSHTVLPGPPNRFAWDSEVANELFRFGKWVFLASTLTFLANQGDRLMLGAYLSTREFGIYSIAGFIVLSVDSLFAKLTTSVWYPAMCRINLQQAQRLPTVFYKIRLVQEGGTLVFAVFLIAAGEPLIDLLYDGRYQDAGAIIKILGLALVFSSLNIIIRALMAKGVTVVNTHFVLLRAVVLWASIPLAYTHFGLKGVLWAIALNPITGYPILLWYLRNSGLIVWRREFCSVCIWALAIAGTYYFNAL